MDKELGGKTGRKNTEEHREGNANGKRGMEEKVEREITRLYLYTM